MDESSGVGMVVSVGVGLVVEEGVGVGVGTGEESREEEGVGVVEGAGSEGAVGGSWDSGGRDAAAFRVSESCCMAST